MIVINARFLTQQITGVQRFAIEISLRLKEILKDEVMFVTPNDIIQEDYAKQLDAKVIGKHHGHIWEQLDLPKFLNKNGRPLLLCLCNTAPLCYKNKVVTVHDVAFYVFPQTFSKSFLYVYKFMIPRVMRTAKRVITVSEYSKQEIIKYCHIPSDQISIVYNAVSGNFKHIADESLRNENYFLAVSSMNYRKNFSAVLKAFKDLEKINDSAKLFIIGDLSNSSFKTIDLEEYKSDKRIKFLGRVSDSDLVRYYSNAVAFIYPSLYEGFGIPPLEAQQCHCPVICSDASSLPEVVKDSAMLCAPNDIKALAEDMERLYEDSSLREELINKGIENSKRFSWDENAKKIVSILSQYKF